MSGSVDELRNKLGQPKNVCRFCGTREPEYRMRVLLERKEGKWAKSGQAKFKAILTRSRNACEPCVVELFEEAIARLDGGNNNDDERIGVL